MHLLRDKLTSGKKVITAEISPPKGAGIKKLVRQAELLKPFVDAINITDCQRALVRMSSTAACRVLLDHGIEPVVQMTCRDRNGIALQADLFGAYALGIRNILCLTGDPVKVGDSPTSKSVFEMESVGLLNLIQKLQNGTDGTGKKLNAPTKFHLGAVVNPTLRSPGQWTRLEKKIEAGASFFQTQANYDIEDFRSFLEKTQGVPAKVLAGILVLHSYEVAKYIHEHIPGIQVPDSVLERFKNASDPLNEGISFAVETMRTLEPYCDGFHVMTIREEEIIPQVMERYYGT